MVSRFSAIRFLTKHWLSRITQDCLSSKARHLHWTWPVLTGLVVFAFQSCIKDPPLNPEADIETFVVVPSQLAAPTSIDQANRKILLYLDQDAYEKGIKPTLTLSTGASVVPASGDSIHFDNGPVQYVVTSQSGENKKPYDVQVINVGNWAFNFEQWEINEADQYEYPVEDDGTILWSSGNPGVAISGIPKNPQAYPTHSTTSGYLSTKGAEMSTLKGTPLTEFVGIRLIAGSLFLGVFNSEVAFVDPLAATEFGEPYVGTPSRFTGYYKYTPGPSFQDQDGKIIAGQQDKCSIYAVLFNGPRRLTGHDILTSDKIVATAILSDGSPQAAFTRFDIPFTPKPGAAVSNNLMLAIVASSSAEGDHYRGAIGSNLVVDSLRVVPKEE